MKADRLVDAWLNLQRNWWAHKALEELIRENPSQGLRALENIAHRAEGDLMLLGMLAAGPLEDLLAWHGENIIGEVEALAKRDPAIRRCLAGVWQNQMSDEIFARVQRSAEPGFKFPNEPP